MLLQLNRIQLDSPLNQSGQCLILTELILPRNGIARKAALKDVRLTKGKASFARAPFYEKALLKEKVDGLFGLRVSVTRPLKHPALNPFLRQLLATGIESSTDLLSPLLIRYSPLGDVLGQASEALADSIADTSPTFIATGGLDLDSETFTSGKITIPLKLTETIRSSQEVPLSQKREKRRRISKTYKKGSLLGEISLDLLGD